MANPEIDLPPTSSTLDIAKTEKENISSDLWKDDASAPKERQKEDEAQADFPITYQYLTFDTELPHPTHLCSKDEKGGPAPEPPDLANYISPFTWSESRKNLTTWLSCVATVVTAYTAGAYSAGSIEMSREFGVSQIAIFVGITTFTTGFAIAPMVLAPFSEINGRKPVFVVTGILFVVCQLCCAVTRSFPGLLVARFFAGVGGSTFSTMVGGVLSDIYHTEDRNTPMALFAGAALFGTGLGPLVSGFIAQNVSWRWVFYVQIISCGLVILAVVVFFKETRGSVLLSRKAQILNQWYEAREKAGYAGLECPPTGVGVKPRNERIRWKVKSDEERETLAKMIAIAVGAILSTVLSIYQEKVAKHYGKFASDPEDYTPERRLYFSCVQSGLLPIGLFWFGWTQFSHIHWIVPTLGIGCATMGIFSIYLAVFNYLADTYHRYASSALAAQSFCTFHLLRIVLAKYAD
ncbi:MAG: hypothetical protein Q9187_001913 [Circinaria calcarea]